MKNRISRIALFGLFLLASPAIAGENDWIGLYKGLDSLDGSIDYMSISSSGPGVLEIRTMPSVISLCETGRGWIVAEGRVLEDKRLHRQNAQVFCEDSEPFDIDDVYFVRDDQTGVVRFEATDDRRPLIYHRISTN